MRIVHVARQFHPAVGGFENVVLELASSQVARGHDVRIVTLDRLFNVSGAGRLPKKDVIQGAEVVRIPYLGSKRYPIAPAVLRYLRRADIVHVHCIDFFFDFLAWTKPLHRRRLVVSTHGGFFHTAFASRLKRLWFLTVTRMSLRWYDAVVAVSVADRELFGRLRQRGIVCIENGANISKFAGAGAPYASKKFAWIGRFARNKRLDWLMDFVAAVRRRDREWSLKLAGRPWDLQVSDIAGLASNAGIEPIVQISTAPTEEEIRRSLADCAVIISTSEYEGFGIVPAEGMSAGLLPVLNDIPPFRRLVERSGDGLIVDFSNPELAAEQFLRHWNKTADRFGDVREALMRAAKSFDWQQVSRDYMSLYEAVLGTSTRTILDVPIRVRTFSEAVELLDDCFDKQGRTIVAFANANCLNIASANARHLGAMRDAVVINDGVGIDIASRLLFGSSFPRNLNGTDFTPQYLQNTRHRYRIFLLGAKPGVTKRVAAVLGLTCPRHQVVGYRDGYFHHDEDPSVAELINRARADVVIICTGHPHQEIWLRDNLPATGCRLGIAAGGLFDFMSGEARRAPSWVRKARLEWAYRLAREPRRLWRRYIIGNPIFVLRIVGQWLSGARV